MEDPLNTTKLTTAARQLRKSLEKETLTQLGRETGFAERLREVTPHRLAVSVIGALASQRIETIADILRGFNALTGANVQYKPFHNQLAKDEFPRFMESVFEHVLRQSAMQVLAPVPGNALNRFSDILIQDGTSFAVHDSLQVKFAGRFNAVSPAAVELHATMSVLRDEVVRVALAPDVQGERAFLPAPISLEGKLLLADRGYCDIDYCDEVNEARGSFIIRNKGNVNPVVHGCYIKGRARREFEALSLQEVLVAIGKRSADFEVGWQRPGARLVMLRLVALWNPQTQEHVILVTNLDRDEFDPETVATLYRLRWQVELLFKEWKSYANLHAFGTTKAPIAEGLIWASLTAALLKRFLCHATAFVFSLVQGTSTRRTAMALTNSCFAQLLQSLLRHRGTINRLRHLLDFLHGNARRAHPARDRAHGRLRHGLQLAQVAHAAG